MPRKVITARLHSSIHVPNVGELSSQLPPPAKTFKKFDLLKEEDGISLKVESLQGIKGEAWIPSSNIIYAILAPEETSSKK